jgi:hypothetical protein
MSISKRSQCLLVALSVLGVAVLAVVAVALLGMPDGGRLRARRAWKEAAIPEIARRADDKDWVAKETAMLKESSEREPRVIAEHWLNDRMILMANGEWLVYKSHCHKVPPHDVRDICLAKGSDGKWYYTTCHFCVGMTALRMMQRTQPTDLASFAKRYHLREFDGKSDECLKETKAFPDQL